MLQSCMLTEALQAILVVSPPPYIAFLSVLLCPVQRKCQGLGGPRMTISSTSIISLQHNGCAFLQLAAATFADIGGYYFDLSQDLED